MDNQNIFDRIFPIKYDFYEMLDRQAGANVNGINALCNWLDGTAEAEYEALIRSVEEADKIRMLLEKDLIEAFSTPFDRVDIYSISVSMDKVIEYAKSTLLSMKAYEVSPDKMIINMTEKLKAGADIFLESVKGLKNNLSAAHQNITLLRETHVEIEQIYRDGMSHLFKSSDPMFALKYREVYHHIKDASENLENSVDILHRIVVRLT